ncbi:MAG: hypothetical protein RL375_4177 [Pseudomonadota bacterium]|jgi:hypothetical protein
MELMPQRKTPPPPTPEPVAPSPIRELPNTVTSVTPGAGVIRERKKYNEYVIQTQSSGGTPKKFEDWLAGQR